MNVRLGPMMVSYLITLPHLKKKIYSDSPLKSKKVKLEI